MQQQDSMTPAEPAAGQQSSSQPQPPSQPQSQQPPAVPDGNGGSTQSKQIGKYKVEVIRSKCISAASCVAIAPGVFDLDEEQIAIVISQDGNDDETKLLAAQSCPTAAIIVTDTQTGQQVWPVE